MKKTFLLSFLLAGIAAVPVGAQQNKQSSLDDQFIIYKWQENGIANYAKNPPRGIEKYITLNQYGMEVTKERPSTRKKKTRLIHPPKPQKPQAKEMARKKTEKPAEETDKEGVITRKQRCDTAQKNIKLLTSQKTIYEEDEGENLVPLDTATVAKRLEQAQKAASKFCSEKQAQ